MHENPLEAGEFFSLQKLQSNTLDLLSLKFSVLKLIMMCNWHHFSSFKLIQPVPLWKPEKARQSITSITNTLLSSSVWEQSRWKDTAGKTSFGSVWARDCVLGKSYRIARSGTADRSSGHCQHLSFSSLSLISSEIAGNSPEFVTRSNKQFSLFPSSVLFQSALSLLLADTQSDQQ